VIPRDAPGLGIELDEDAALANPYEGDELHLSPVSGSVDDG
jgi:galactonate dehydratase